MNTVELRSGVMSDIGVLPLLDTARNLRALDRWKQILGRASVVQHCEPEKMLLSMSMSSRKSFLVEQGVVALGHHLSSGKQVFLTLRAPGQIFGHSRHVLSHSFELSATALTPCVIRMIDTQWLVDQIKRGGEAGLLLLEQHASDLHESSTTLMELSHLDASARLERFLVQFACAQEISFTDETAVSLPLADGYLASLLGISAQQFSAVKRRLAAEGKVRHVRETHTWILSSGQA